MYMIYIPFLLIFIPSGVYGPEIGDMDEGIIEGCEYSGNAEYELSCGLVSIVQSQNFSRN
jgi:hypothetical protein